MWTARGFLMKFGLILVQLPIFFLAYPSFAQNSPCSFHCKLPPPDEVIVPTAIPDRREGDEGQWRCEGPTTVGTKVRLGDTCADANAIIDCDGTVKIVEIVRGNLPCPTGEGAFRTYCDPISKFFTSNGFCRLVDYYGNRIELRVTAPPHEFEARPYPVGFVAREDPFGTFHPTFRLRWIPPVLWNRHGDYPTYADSGWILWSWEKGRGPGNPNQHPFPCDFSETDLMRHNVPAGTTCLRAQLWSAPWYDEAKNPILLPGELRYPARNIRAFVPPGRVIELNFPYASHPDTRQTIDVEFDNVGSLPAFPGYFQRWWYVRFRIETRVVEDVPGTRLVCRPTSRRPVQNLCYPIENNRQVIGEWVTETYVERKQWVKGETSDEILDLRKLGHHYEALHPRQAIIRGTGTVFRSGLVPWNGQWWLLIPIAVREGQGVVCANPGCTGSEPLIP
ncbi:MAG: hypothetical protein RMK32_00760 [Anaerolineae bacterium]|nr:hypothetical protein [Anaerolineae bacterium]